MKTNYFRKIYFSDFDVIREKCLDIVKLHDHIYRRYKQDTSYYKLDYRFVLEKCPELVKALSEYNLECNYVMAYVMYEKAHTSIHTDNYVHRCRINLPLLNCENTFTAFYENVTFKNKISPLGLPYGKSVYQDHKPVDMVELDTPTILAVSEAHSVIMPDNAPAPRISLSIGTRKDPNFLLDEFWYKDIKNYCDVDLLESL
jgi:hypothetical protein